jgi:hypothetical protein
LIPILEQYVEEENIDINAQSAVDVIFAQLQGSILMAKLHNDPNKLFEALNTFPQILASLATKNDELKLIE